MTDSQARTRVVEWKKHNSSGIAHDSQAIWRHLKLRVPSRHKITVQSEKSKPNHPVTSPDLSILYFRKYMFLPDV